MDAADRERLLALLESRGQVSHYETRLRRHDGRTIHVEITVHARGAEDGTIVYEGAITDITERRVAEAALWESERRLRVLVEQVPAVLWSVSRDLRFTLSMGGGLAALGLKPRQVVGQTIFEFFQTEDRAHPAIAAHPARPARGVERVPDRVGRHGLRVLRRAASRRRAARSPASSASPST